MSDPSAADVEGALAAAGQAGRRVSAEAVPPNCLAQPSPSMILIGSAKADGEPMELVILRIEMVTGSTIVSLDPDSAIDVARRIHETAHRAKSGLVIPSAPGILPT